MIRRGEALGSLLCFAGAQTVSTDTPAIAAVRVKAKAGDVNAHFDLGWASDAGTGVPQDAVESPKRRTLAASPVSAENQKEFAEAREWLAGSEKCGGEVDEDSNDSQTSWRHHGGTAGERRSVWTATDGTH